MQDPRIACVAGEGGTYAVLLACMLFWSELPFSAWNSQENIENQNRGVVCVLGHGVGVGAKKDPTTRARVCVCVCVCVRA